MGWWVGGWVRVWVGGGARNACRRRCVGQTGFPLTMRVPVRMPISELDNFRLHELDVSSRKSAPSRNLRVPTAAPPMGEAKGHPWQRLVARAMRQRPIDPCSASVRCDFGPPCDTRPLQAQGPGCWLEDSSGSSACLCKYLCARVLAALRVSDAQTAQEHVLVLLKSDLGVPRRHRHVQGCG